MALTAPLARGARRGSGLGLLCGVLAAGCNGEVLDLGSAPLQAGAAGMAAGGGVAGSIGVRDTWGVQGQPLLPQAENVLVANPTLTAAMDELYFSEQTRGGTPDVHRTSVKRALPLGAGWSTGVEQKLGDTVEPDVSSPAVSANGQELWLGMNVAGSTDVFRCLRQGGAWTSPTRVPELSNDLYDDAPRPPAVNGTIMPLSSKRHGGQAPLYQIYLSSRASADATWSEPSSALLGTIDSEAFQSADGFLSEDGLELYFSSTRDGEHADSDLYLARRGGLDAPFGEPEALSELNDPDPQRPSDERMPWLSPDKKRLYFASNHTGQYALYLATKP